MDRKAWLRRTFEHLCSLCAIVVPTFAALSRLAVDSAWHNDLAVVRGLGLVSVAGPAALSTVTMQAASLVPIGSLGFRLAVMSALGLGLCAAAIQLLARQLLHAHVPNSFLNVPLAAIAALTATLGPALQREGTMGGGSTFSLAVGLLALAAVRATTWARAQRIAVAATLLGALLAECPQAAAVAAGAILCSLIVSRDIPRKREWLPGLLCLLTATAILSLPVVVRPGAPHVWLNIGRSLTTRGLVAIDTAAVRTTALHAWHTEVGTISLGLAGLGVMVGLWRSRARPCVLSLAVLIAADVAFPATTGAVLSPDLLAPVRALAVAAVAISAALGVQAAATTLVDTGIPMARYGAALLLMFNLTLVAVASEQAAFTVDRSHHHGASVYVDEVLEKLESNAMVLVRSHAACWRLLSARVLGGARPDVVLVASPLIHRGAVAARLLAVEPSIALLLRDVAIDFTPGEHAISRLADMRWLYVELDPAWTTKVASHLVADGLWLRVSPQPQGASDRKLSIAAGQNPFDKMTSAIRSVEPVDRATATVLLASARQQAVAAAMVGDRKATQAILDRIAAFDANDLFVRYMEQRLDHAKGSAIDVRGLLP